MSKVNYLEILKKAWDITWKNRYLWWFGFFLALGLNGLSSNQSFNAEKDGKNQEKVFSALANFYNHHQELVITLFAIVSLLLILLIILKIISRAGLIKSVAEIEKGKVGSFKKGFGEGKKYFWRVLAINFIVGIFTFFLIAVIFSPIVFLIYLKSYIVALFLGILAIIIFIVLMVLVSFLKEYAQIYLIISNISVNSALESGYQLFIKNIWPSIIFSIIFIPISLVLGIGIFLSFLIFVLTFGIIGLIFYFLFAKVGALIIAILGILAFAIFVLALGSVFETFKQTAWVLFFQEVASIKEEDLLEEKVTEVSGKALEGGEA
jgi:hypothetical protein